MEIIPYVARCYLLFAHGLVSKVQHTTNKEQRANSSSPFSNQKISLYKLANDTILLLLLGKFKFYEKINTF